MEVLFENSYVRDKKFAKDIYKYLYFHRVSIIVSYVFLSLIFCANILLWIFEEYYNLFVLVLVPSLFAFRLYSYFRSVKLMVKRDSEVHGKEVTVESVVTGEGIQSSVSTGSVSTLAIGNIKKAVNTKKFILLHTEAKMIHIFPKDTFTKGNAEDFIKFLKDKGIKVK